MLLHEAAVGFQAQDDGVEEDDADDEVLDAGGFDPFGEAQTPRGDTGTLAEFEKVRFAHEIQNRSFRAGRVKRGLVERGRREVEGQMEIKRKIR